jgi:hypothetical protein
MTVPRTVETVSKLFNSEPCPASIQLKSSEGVSTVFSEAIPSLASF